MHAVRQGNVGRVSGFRAKQNRTEIKSIDSTMAIDIGVLLLQFFKETSNLKPSR